MLRTSLLPLMLVLPMLAACTMEHQIVSGGFADDDDDDDRMPSFGSPGEDEDDGTDDWSDEGDDAEESSGEDDGSGPDGSDGDDEDDDGESDDTGETTPRAPKKGEIVINELMVDPTSVVDATGEWVELRNVGSAALDLSDHLLIDADVDIAELTPTGSNSLVVESGDYLMLCASDSWADNGGIECDATYPYSTWGEGFALANSGDEVGLITPEGDMLDAVVFEAEEVPVGASMGVDPSYADPDSNDDAWAWCAQEGALSGSDEGTPGRKNSDCD